MKADIHPKWHKDATFSCACGHTFTAGSTKPQTRVEICYACHPFFTGEMRFIDTQGRVEKFQAKQKQAKGTTYVKKRDKRALLRKEEEEAEKRRPKSLKEMLHRE